MSSSVWALTTISNKHSIRTWNLHRYVKKKWMSETPNTQLIQQITEFKTLSSTFYCKESGCNMLLKKTCCTIKPQGETCCCTTIYTALINVIDPVCNTGGRVSGELAHFNSFLYSNPSWSVSDQYVLFKLSPMYLSLKSNSATLY